MNLVLETFAVLTRSQIKVSEPRRLRKHVSELTAGLGRMRDQV